MLEIIVISIIGAAALVYLIYFFIRESKRKNVCAGCPYAAGCNKNKKGIKKA
jgi:uncharacterized membrane protein